MKSITTQIAEMEGINEARANEVAEKISANIEEGILTGLLGGLVGATAGAAVMKAVCKALGIGTDSKLYSLLTSNAVCAAVGYSLGK